MVYRIVGGISLTLLGASMLGITMIPEQVTATFLVIGGVALLAGI